MSARELAAYKGVYTQQSIGPTGVVETAQFELVAAGGQLLLTVGGVTYARLALYRPDYVVLRGPNGEPISSARANFVRGTGRRVEWLRLSGRLARHETTAPALSSPDPARRSFDPFRPWLTMPL